MSTSLPFLQPDVPVLSTDDDNNQVSTIFHPANSRIDFLKSFILFFCHKFG
jgi:hypothetical protein